MLFKSNCPYLAGETFGHVKVNLAATDEQILNDFSHWLTEIRKHLPMLSRKKNFTSVDFRRWCDLGVLPYMDLILWGRWNKIHITQYVMGEALFPGEDMETTDKIRRSTRKVVEQLLTCEYSDAIIEQALAIYPRKRKAS